MSRRAHKGAEKTRRLSVSFSDGDWAKLELLATQRGLSPEALVRSWIDAGFEFSGLGEMSPHAAETATIQELARLIERQNERIRAIEAALSQSRNSDSTWDYRHRNNERNGGDTADRPRNGRSTGRGRPSLHEEIRAVLAEAGQPMRARDIAEAIRKRGTYRSPRSGKSVTAAMVSSRVSNPLYRDLFRRADRKIALKS